jgi:hypothetical protein
MTKKRPCKNYSLAKFRTLNDFSLKKVKNTRKSNYGRHPNNRNHCNYRTEDVSIQNPRGIL